MTTPVLGSSGPGEQIPSRELAVPSEPSTTENPSRVVTAASPAAASPLATVGARTWVVILPSGFTNPAATLVPPTSTPITRPCGQPQTLITFFSRPDPSSQDVIQSQGVSIL